MSTQTAGALPASRPRELADVSPPRAGSPVGQTKGEVPRSAVSHANDKQELREDSLEKHSVGGQRPCPHPRRRGRGAGRGRASPGAQGPGAGSGGLLTCRGPRASCNARRLFRSTDQGVSGGPGPLWLQPQDTVHQVSLGERNWDKSQVYAGGGGGGANQSPRETQSPERPPPEKGCAHSPSPAQGCRR